MRVVVISSSPLVAKDSRYFAYSPYVKELGIWAKYSDEIAFMCPVWKADRGLLVSPIDFPVAKIFEAREFNVKSFGNLLRAITWSFGNFYKIYQGMRWADHVHLRCPGNIGLMGCLVQILFPKKQKTAKYAGNWDPNAIQPLSYRVQKWILNNTFLTRNMQVMVYGEWQGSSRNIKPFFTASYHESDKLPAAPKKLDGSIRFIFAGTLAPGKRPLYAVQLVERLHQQGFKVSLSIYGHGKKKEALEKYIAQHKLESVVCLKGNQPAEAMKKAYGESHFLLLPSKSEGWPKVVAEAMFWGCLPIATPVSCVPFMLDGGNRGILLEMNPEADVHRIAEIARSPEIYSDKVVRSILWSRQYTLDLFEKEINALLHP